MPKKFKRKARITPAQKSARRRNIEVARKARHYGKKGDDPTTARIRKGNKALLAGLSKKGIDAFPMLAAAKKVMSSGLIKPTISTSPPKKKYKSKVHKGSPSIIISSPGKKTIKRY